jgi:DNA-3-methyladenine glycosylase I
MIEAAVPNSIAEADSFFHNLGEFADGISVSVIDHRPSVIENVFTMSYCEIVWQMEKGNVHVHYHDHEYGFPIKNDNHLFARLVLEINQAGLSWTTILNKKKNFFKAYDDFDIRKVASYDQKQIKRLLNDPGIIRNKLKIHAAIDNAKKIMEIQSEHGSFRKWLDKLHPLTREEWVKIFKNNFRFTGGEIVNEFLVSSGYLPGAHIPACPIYEKVIKMNPPWLKAAR